MKKVLDIIRVFTRREITLIFDKIEFEFTQLPWKKICNWFIGEISFLLRTRRAWAFPTHIQVEPASGCNLRCPLCYITVYDVKEGLLELDNFKRFIDEVGDYMFILHFWGWGEPFLNKDIYAMINYAHKRGIKIITSTNGHILDLDKLIDSGLDAIVIAVDGINQESYEKTRRKGNFKVVVDNLRSLGDKRKERSVKNPIINLRMVVTRENEKEIPRMKNLAKEVGADIFSLKTLGSHDNEGLWKESLATNHEYRRYRYDAEDKPIRIKNNCKRMWNHPYIFYDGDVANCTYALKGEVTDTPLGNAFTPDEGGFSRIWFGQDYIKTRADFLDFCKGKEGCGPVRCRTCNWNYTDSKNYVSHAFDLRETDE